MMITGQISLLVFFVAACMSYDLNLIARIPVGELLAFASVPFLLRGIRFNHFADRVKPVLGIFALWILGVVISDFVNASSLTNFLRGFAKPVWCFLWMLFFFGILIKSPRSLFWYPAGAVVASLQNYFFPQAWTAQSMINEGSYEAIAFGVVPIFGSMCVLFSVLVYRKSRLLASGIFMLNAVALIVVGAPRSTVAMCLLVAIVLGYLAWRNQFSFAGRSRALTIKAVFFYGVGAFIACILLFELYVFAASNRWLGEVQYQKYVSQSSTVFGNSLLGLILGGRTAVFGAVLGILDRPLIGFGSWSGIGLSEYYYDAVSFVGTDAQELGRLSQSGISPAPGHSIFFAAWMENGILSGFAMIGIAILMVKQLLKLLQLDHPLAPWILMSAVGFFWAFLFSPFGVGSRVVIGLFLAFSVYGHVFFPVNERIAR